ncbi:SRPBCC family protein [Demequina capsici]|uniref:SRPBCC family protein n=1 Tax=Demequina capsici TaxID=3075620 RepID=A0AA96F651_9MICO|nr:MULTISPECIES: SRPBCC family protein [unclassified Demequina]WNM24322.1 SRPBCC family protein [Demequina sp. OYTSA14]WNM27144.1 SRPBCC family protein [Demequina sp. PMTSA13]
MPITNVEKDLDALTMTITAEFPVPVSRLWGAFDDPRQLEQFWGPPGWPARFTRHDMAVGGRSHYTMTGPEGESSSGYWEFTRIEPGKTIELVDGFATDDGEPNPQMPTMRMSMVFEPTDAGSRFVSTTWFNSLDELNQLLEMGMEQGTLMAMGQMDRVLEGLREFAAGKGTLLEELSEVHVRITRWIEADRDTVWHAYNTPELMRQWLLGPDGWRMTECEMDLTKGGSYRYAWEPEEGTEGTAFGFEGECLLAEPPYRAVTTERMRGTPAPQTTNDLTMVEDDGGTLLTLVIQYPDEASKEFILGTGMVEGMETSYARLERMLQDD